MRMNYNMIHVSPDDGVTFPFPVNGFRVFAVADGAAVRVRTITGDEVLLYYGTGTVTYEPLVITALLETDTTQVDVHILTDAPTPD